MYVPVWLSVGYAVSPAGRHQTKHLCVYVCVDVCVCAKGCIPDMLKLRGPTAQEISARDAGTGGIRGGSPYLPPLAAGTSGPQAMEQPFDWEPKHAVGVVSYWVRIPGGVAAE